MAEETFAFTMMINPVCGLITMFENRQSRFYMCGDDCSILDEMDRRPFNCAHIPYVCAHVRLLKCNMRIRRATKDHDRQVLAEALTPEGRKIWAQGDLPPGEGRYQKTHSRQTTLDNFLKT